MEMPKDLTLEINASHPTIVNLNILRKEAPEFATEVSQVFLESVLTSSNIPFDTKESFAKNQMVMEEYLNESISLKTGGSRSSTIEAEPIHVSEPHISNVNASDDENESILNRAHRDIRSNSN